MNASVSIIIGFTPFHLLPIQELLTVVYGDVYIFHPLINEYQFQGSRDQLFFLGGCDKLDRSRQAKYFYAGRDINRIIHNHSQVDVYIPHPFNPLSNYAFFHSEKCRRFIYQDGILNYYDALSQLSSLKWRIRQLAMAAAVGLTYTTYTGHLSGVDSKPIAGGFFTDIDRIVRIDKFQMLKKLNFRSRNENEPPPRGNDTLFLDQPIEQSVNTNLTKELRRRTVDYVNNLGTKVFYKPHYSQGKAASLDTTWIPIERELCAMPAEWVVDRLDIKNVVSFCTSALANITIKNDFIDCYATGANLITVSVDRRQTTLAEVLSGFGVKVVRLLS